MAFPKRYKVEVSLKENPSFNEWELSEDKPGYRVKRCVFDNAIVNLYRPIHTTEEEAKLEKDIGDCLASLLNERLREAERRAATSGFDRSQFDGMTEEELKAECERLEAELDVAAGEYIDRFLRLKL